VLPKKQLLLALDRQKVELPEKLRKEPLLEKLQDVLREARALLENPQQDEALLKNRQQTLLKLTTQSVARLL
jgi:hypothetical protein